MKEEGAEMRRKGRLWNGLLELLYPPKCICCGRLLERVEQAVCASCAAKLAATDGGSCAQSGAWFGQCVSPFFLEGLVGDSLSQFKFHHREGNGDFFGQQMGACARENLAGAFDLITWVPVSRKRRWERGFDQSKVLAAWVAASYGTKPRATLKKQRNIMPLSQTKGGGEVRQALVKGIYDVVEPCSMTGKRVLLIDDIITTGATLNEASRVLILAGATEVCCVTAARSRQSL